MFQIIKVMYVLNILNFLLKCLFSLSSEIFDFDIMSLKIKY